MVIERDETMVFVRSPCGRQQWIYFIQAGVDGPIKIGVTNNVSARLATHQIGNHEELQVLCAIPSSGPGHERALHKSFARHHIRGEWFHPSPEILRIVETWVGSQRIPGNLTALLPQFPVLAEIPRLSTPIGES